MKHFQFLFAIIFMMGWGAFAQSEIYSLEDCIKIALENNIDLRSANLRANSAKINHQQSKANILPTINGTFNLGKNDGRSIDPFTNDFINQELTFSNMGLSLDFTVFNGFRLLNAAKQNRLNRKAAEQELEAAKQDLVLSVTLAYLQVLNNKAVLGLTEQRYEATKQQLKNQEDFYKNESGNPADYADILGQLANDETSILTTQSNLNNSIQRLLRLLNLPSDFEIDPQNLMLEVENYNLTAEEVYKAAIENLATFKANELRIEAAKKGVSVAKSQFTPEISIFGGVNTNYSSAAQLFNLTGSTIVDTGAFVTVEGQEISVQSEQPIFETQTISYEDQLDNNLNTVIGVSVNVPLFNGFRAKNNVALEKIRVQESMLELERTHLDIKNNIAQVHFDMVAAYGRYQSLLKQVEAYEESYRINEIRFNNGVSNFLSYVTSKNNLDASRVNLENAKYDYLLRVKVLDYYRGINF